MKKLILLYIFISTAFIGLSQSSEFHKYRIKGMGEFMARFNGTEYTDMVNPSMPDFERQKLLQLFDAEIAYRPQGSEQEIMAFTDSILQNDVKISLGDSTWIAEAKINMILNGKKYSLSMFLQMENFAPEKYKWSILDVKGLNATGLLDSISIGAINPTENELDFVQLESIMEYEPEKIASYRAKDVTVDELSAFFTLVQYKVLKWGGVQSVKYHFLSVPGYIFTVERFIRDGSNAGWLISDFHKADAIDKKNFISH